MKGITLRRACPDDMPGCARVFLRAASDLSRRQGNYIPQVRPRETIQALAHLQRTDPTDTFSNVTANQAITASFTAQTLVEIRSFTIE